MQNEATCRSGTHGEGPHAGYADDPDPDEGRGKRAEGRRELCKTKPPRSSRKRFAAHHRECKTKPRDDFWFRGWTPGARNCAKMSGFAPVPRGCKTKPTGRLRQVGPAIRVVGSPPNPPWTSIVQKREVAKRSQEQFGRFWRFGL